MQYTGNTIKLGTELCDTSGCLDSGIELNDDLIKVLKRDYPNKKRKRK